MLRILTASAVLLACPAEAEMLQIKCIGAADARAALTEQFGEVVIGRGLNERGHMTEVWQSENGTYSVTVTTPDGRTCMLDAGMAWESMPAVFGEAM